MYIPTFIIKIESITTFFGMIITSFNTVRIAPERTLNIPHTYYYEVHTLLNLINERERERDIEVSNRA